MKKGLQNGLFCLIELNTMETDFAQPLYNTTFSEFGKKKKDRELGLFEGSINN